MEPRMPAGETVTTLEADVWSKRMVIHTGYPGLGVSVTGAAELLVESLEHV